LGGSLPMLCCCSTSCFIVFARGQGGDGDDEKFWSEHPECFSRCAFPGTKMSALPVWWMLLPYFLFGISECLSNIPLLDLCYSQTPPAYASPASSSGARGRLVTVGGGGHSTLAFYSAQP